jgi:hypothetical protein
LSVSPSGDHSEQRTIGSSVGATLVVGGMGTEDEYRGRVMAAAEPIIGAD